MRSGLIIACLAALSTAACASPGPRPGPDAASVAGHATFYEKLLMPAESVLTIRLLDADIGSVVERAERVAASSPPYAFTLHYDPRTLAPGARLAIEAELSDPRGERMFATPAPVPVADGRTRPETFRMVHLSP